ncbi:MAG: quinohemoprotein amine dehydrogenase subunit alpha [Alphaproteobacteria bacterium]
MFRQSLPLLALTSLLLATPPAHADEHTAELLNERCGGCHEPTDQGLARIKDQRKTPEAWDMTIVRMMQLHGVEVTAEERAGLVKHLADSQGMAPAETEGFRYILEREPAVVETPPSDDLATMCARCHSYARVALQRRTQEEWTKLAHFHLGQYPTAEYQALARDRNWWEIASEQVPAELAELYPLQTDAWDSWKDRPAPDLAGTWRFVGSVPGRGGYQGVATLTATGDDGYDYALTTTYDDGHTADGQGSAILYSGFEWRSRTTIGDSVSLQVLALDADGNRLTGRSFYEDQDSLGGRMTVVRAAEGASQVLALSPPYLRAGDSAEIAIHGIGLSGDVSLGDGVTIDSVVSSDANTIVVKASAAADAAGGARAASVGEASADGAFAVYQAIDRVSVEPAYAIARVGDGGGPVAPVPAQFAAVGWLNGPDGAPETDDDIRLGAMPATFSITDFDEVAADMKDVEYSGKMEANGIFMPAAAGPNPDRPYQTNNAGNLKVIAAVEDGGQTLTGEGQLLVTVQRWNDPPIR